MKRTFCMTALRVRGRGIVVFRKYTKTNNSKGKRAGTKTQRSEDLGKCHRKLTVRELSFFGAPHNPLNLAKPTESGADTGSASPATQIG